jgi:hypothetical protein
LGYFVGTNKPCRTYEINTSAKNCIGGEDLLEQFGFIIPEFLNLKCPGLFLEYIRNRIGAVVVIDLEGKWVVAKICCT